MESEAVWENDMLQNSNTASKCSEGIKRYRRLFMSEKGEKVAYCLQQA